MKRLLIVICAVVVAGVLSVSPASASPVALSGGGVGSGNSWTFTFENTTFGALFDKIEIFITGGGAAFDAAATVSGPAGWGGTLVNPTYTYIGGPATGLNQWITLNFAGSAPAGGVAVDFLTWNAGSPVAGQFWRYTNVPYGGASGPWELITDYDPGDYNRSVPDGGATLTLLGCALVGVGALRRRFRV